jgi:glycosyltransferase involved in cell wall biosynthesis
MQLGIAKRGLIHTLRYRALDAWLSPLPGLANEVVAKTRLPTSCLHVVPLGIELEKFAHNALTQAQARLQLDLALPPNALLLGLVGRFDDGKGQDFVVQALARLRRRYSHLHLLLIGESTRNKDNSYKEAVLAQIQALGLSEVVHVRAFTLQPEVAYRALDISITASVNETYGMVTIEAMASGLPVIASATGGTLEIVDDGRTGLLFPLHDGAKFDDSVEQLVQRPKFAKQLGKQAQLEALAAYSHHHQCELTEEVLYSLVFNKRK